MLWYFVAQPNSSLSSFLSAFKTELEQNSDLRALLTPFLKELSEEKVIELWKAATDD